MGHHPDNLTAKRPSGPLGTHDFQDDIDATGASDAIPTLLQTVCLATGMGFAAVARVTEDRWVTCRAVDHIGFGLNPGDELEVESTLCHEVRQADTEIVIPDVATDQFYCNHHTPARYGFRSYISVPVYRADGSFFGTLCAIDPEPRDLKDPRVLDMFRLFARSVGENLHAVERLSEARQELSDERDLGRLREEFMAILGHDLRNPVASMRAGLRMLAKRSLDAGSADLVRHLRSSALRMSGLVENSLDYTQVRLGDRMRISSEACANLAETLEHVVQEIRSVVTTPEIEAEIDVPDEVVCDAGRLGQLLSNLLSNAVTHGDAAHPIRVRVTGTEAELEIAVANGGSPIPETTRARLFDPYVRGESHPSNRGLGLGLHIASQIAQGHGGALEVRSDAGGTEFSFRMPLKPVA